ncbi:LamG-like jellyroll fold domain-containing protein [Cellvibrio japonicus]|uniref:Carbohydrate binding protein, putative, cbp35A n=1 Tax=Cellvibrio japonicus (strain Ueda107) TaxID=498211 RepID=B3PEP0_CELJU|nr:LamG-like jellyroll fold domain-containing protein [Cellvibrio japonicus]ACE85711.1 carbohydrate binding protein, putative, cbp35A [Cellvibrio japonicus Ueda107]QEI10781.1 carbohydrate-binding protein [Cellvibrio japonicus]QEI14357.1 carbohydrate-binding protein [Cellvibrio japonicus]QEI17935.1 carbohydrate-binding protein [Cellvibrio japonicus]
MRILGIFVGIFLGIVSIASQAEEALCAEVKIEILQELTMERQGFEAMMRITNSLDTFSLENVSVKVIFSDSDGNPVVATSNTSASGAAFFIRVDDTQDVTGLQQGADGYVHSGSIAPQKVGEMRWLIIPTANAAGQTKDGKLYFVGAELRYSYGGKEEVVNVAEDSIVVKPQPALTLDYFLTEEVVGDNGFTPEIEPPEPYTLGVRINNNGFGAAKSVKIESAQPRIVENKLGLAVNFKILGSYLKDQPSSPSLLINFGNIEPKGITTGRWIMESNLAGKFIAFNASFTHADELGGELTSLLQATNANFLVRDVIVDLPGRDNLRDFLAYNATRNLRVFESEPTGANEVDCANCKGVTEITSASLSPIDNSRSRIEFEPVGGLAYVTAVDPFNGAKVLARVVREDGSIIHPQNAWLSKKRASDNINFNYFVNVFDNNASGKYTVYWGGNLVDTPQPPVIQYVPDQVTYEGGNLGFIVRATDPNNTLPTLSYSPLPAGALFTSSAINDGVFNWSPLPGQAGQYSVIFTATDGEFSVERLVNIKVNPAHDTDGDGMDDDWEREHFGNLDKDGTQDTDGDGRTDLEEFEQGTNPNLFEAAPAAPEIDAPAYNADTLDGALPPLMPELIVKNGNHPAGIESVAIVFEVYKDEALTELMGMARLDEGTGSVQGDKTHWEIAPVDLDEGMEFEDNRLYYWRARSVQNGSASVSSTWIKSRFFINTENDAPTQPQISSPAIEASIAVLSPTLVVTNSTDIDRDELRYGFELYEESDLETPVATVSGLLPGNNGQTSWFVATLLEEDKRYLWQASVTDEHNVVVKSDWGSFVVNTQNHPPTNPQVDSPLPASTVTALQENNSLSLRVINSIDPERKPVKYYFELDTVNTFDSSDKQSSAAITAGETHTEWTASNLVNQVQYFWRVKASDGEADSAWVVSDFTVSVQNQAPSIPVLQNPVDGAVIQSLSVFLEANPAVDPEGSILTYVVEVYSDSALTHSVYSNQSLTPWWQLDDLLANQSTYYWRVKAFDEDGQESEWSSTGVFTVNIPSVNQPPQFSFVAPAGNVSMDANGVLIQWVDDDPDSDAQITLVAKKPDNSSITIASNISENLDGAGDTFILMPGVLPPGSYTLVAIISDEDHSISVPHCCTLTVPEPPQGLLPFSQWLFDEGTGNVTQSSVGEFVAPIKLTYIHNSAATPASWVAGRHPAAETALNFDGRGAYVEIPKTSSQPLLNDASLSFWIKTSQAGGLYPEISPAIIGSHNSDTGDHIKWGSLGLQGQFGLAVGEIRMLGLTRVADNNWHHVVITRRKTPGSDNGIVKIYVDGKLDAVSAPADEKFTGLVNTFAGLATNNRFSSNTPNQIDSTSRFIGGALDDIQIFDRSLTATEVADLYMDESGDQPSITGAYDNFVNQGIYQAEAASLYLGAVVTEHSGYSSIGFVDYDFVAGGYIEWVVERTHAGPVTLEFVYANYSISNRNMDISVNGQVVSPNLAFPNTNSWTNWTTVSANVNLAQGVNRIRATAKLTVGGPNLDYMRIVE